MRARPPGAVSIEPPIGMSGNRHDLDPLEDTGHRVAVRVEFARELPARSRLPRSEPAIVDQYLQRRALPHVGNEQVNGLPRAGSVGETELGTTVSSGLLPRGGDLPCPSRDMLRPFRDAGSVVLVDLIIDGGGIVHTCRSIDPDLSRWCGCRAPSPHESPMPFAYHPAGPLTAG